MIRPARSSPDPGAENPRGVCLVTPPSKPNAVRRGARPKPTSTPTRAARGLTASRLSKHGARNTELGAAHAREPGLAASEARMAKRSRHAVSEGHDARSERPATGHGQPRAAHHTRSPSLTRLGFLTERTSGDWAWAAPSGAPHTIPIAYAIGLPDRANVRREAWTAPTTPAGTRGLAAGRLPETGNVPGVPNTLPTGRVKSVEMPDGVTVAQGILVPFV